MALRSGSGHALVPQSTAPASQGPTGDTRKDDETQSQVHGRSMGPERTVQGVVDDSGVGDHRKGCPQIGEAIGEEREGDEREGSQAKQGPPDHRREIDELGHPALDGGHREADEENGKPATHRQPNPKRAQPIPGVGQNARWTLGSNGEEDDGEKRDDEHDG